MSVMTSFVQFNPSMSHKLLMISHTI